MRDFLVIVAILTALGGCAGLTSAARTSTTGDAEGAAAPGPDLVGTWRGTAMAFAGDLSQTAAPVELTIRPDGTWTWSKRGQEQARGRAMVRGERVLLEEEKSKDTARTIQLQRRGEKLWGVTPAFVPGAMNSVQLEKVAS